jgi:hypothetical protein
LYRFRLLAEASLARRGRAKPIFGVSVGRNVASAVSAVRTTEVK